MGATFAPFFRAGGAMLARSVLLLGTKTMASAVSARRASLPKHDLCRVPDMWLLSSLATLLRSPTGLSILLRHWFQFLSTQQPK